MRKFVFFFCASVLSLAQLASAAQISDSNKKGSTDLPAIVVAGLEAYKNKGPEDAVRAWIKGSPIDGNKEALTQANSLRQIQDFYGAYQTFEVISTRDLAPKTRILYLVLDYEKGPLFAKFVVYRSDQGWILTSFNFDTKEGAILPMLP